jgi:hypothetical protein
MLFTLCSGAFPLVLRGTNHAAFDQLACGVFLVNFRRRCVGALFWGPWVPKLEPSEATRTCRVEVTALPSVHVRNEIFSSGELLRHVYVFLSDGGEIGEPSVILSSYLTPERHLYMHVCPSLPLCHSGGNLPSGTCPAESSATSV